MTRQAPLRMELLSDPLYLSGVREMIAAIARRIGFSEEGCGQIALAIDESLCNVMRHGYDGRQDGPIWVSVWPTDGQIRGIRIVVEDEAKQVDIATIKSRNLDDVRPGGLGVHIIKEVMDEVVYEKRTPKGMRLTLNKYCEPAEKPKEPAHGS